MRADIDNVWNEFSDQIRGYLSSKVRSKDDADDLLQEIFIKIHNNLDDLKDEKKLSPWIHRIVRNSLTDYYRKSSLDTTELNEEITAAESSEIPDDIYAKCVTGCLQVFIDRLPDKYRDPLVLSDIKELKQKDIARDMGLSYSGLKSRVQRGRHMIKEMFIQCSCYMHEATDKVDKSSFDFENCEICNPPAS